MDDADIFKIKAYGPWVLLAPEKPKNISKGGIYLPDGNLPERLGHAVGVVISASPGYWTDTLDRILRRPKSKDKPKFVRIELKPGDRVLFRGHLQNAFKAKRDLSYCFILPLDIVGVLDADAELEPSMPH